MIHNKKTLILSLVLMPFFSFYIKAQSLNTNSNPSSLRAIYLLEYKLDSTVSTPKSEQMILRISNGISCFRHKSQHIRDSVYASLSHLSQKDRTNAANKAWLESGKTEIYYSIFKDPGKNLIFYHDDFRGIDYQYQEKAPVFHWTLTPARKVVAGYECQQAFTAFGGRTWEAWFTRGIPVSEGPYKFYGLPGFIVKVRDTHDNYIFSLLSFENNPRPFAFSVTSSAPLLKKSKFKQAKLNDELTFLDWMASMGSYVSDGMRSNHAERMKHRNNPLELK